MRFVAFSGIVQLFWSNRPRPTIYTMNNTITLGFPRFLWKLNKGIIVTHHVVFCIGPGYVNEERPIVVY